MHGLGSNWVQGHLFNDFWSMCMDVVVISETQVSETKSHDLLLEDSNTDTSFGQLGSSSIQWCYFTKSLELEKNAVSQWQQ